MQIVVQRAQLFERIRMLQSCGDPAHNIGNLREFEALKDGVHVVGGAVIALAAVALVSSSLRKGLAQLRQRFAQKGAAPAAFARRARGGSRSGQRAAIEPDQHLLGNGRTSVSRERP